MFQDILFQIVFFIAVVSIGLNVIYWPYLRQQFQDQTKANQDSQDDTGTLYNGNPITRYPSFDDEVINYSRRLDKLTKESNL